jgi:hypothetical protein
LGKGSTFRLGNQARFADPGFATNEGSLPLPAPGEINQRIQSRKFAGAANEDRAGERFVHLFYDFSGVNDAGLFYWLTHTVLPPELLRFLKAESEQAITHWGQPRLQPLVDRIANDNG